MYEQKTKAERKAWWRGLSPQKQEAYIERVQARKMESRKNSSAPKPVGFEATGVNPENRAEWQALILRRNPWLREGIFN